MRWWGKLIGAATGFVVGGPFGGIVGLTLGHGYDLGAGDLRVAGPEAAQLTFFQALFGTLGHLAKADGRVTPAEVRRVEALMERMDLDIDQRRLAIELFTRGKSAQFQVEHALRPLALAGRGSAQRGARLIKVLIQTILADGEISPPEYAVLLRYSLVLRLSARHLEQLLRANGVRRENPPPPAPSPAIADPYAALGVTPDADERAIKRAYRQLMAKYHPDKMASRQLTPEQRQESEERTRQISAAYDTIRRARS